MKLNNKVPNSLHRLIVGMLFKQHDLAKNRLLKKRYRTKRKKVGILVMMMNLVLPRK